jgi:S-DNA-T family DNA segregation ATPase FtsK/SpoIIIE
MDQDNPAPRLLSRPGEGIYNDAAGALEGNSPFQAVWLSDKTRDGYLAKIRERADENAEQYPGPIVFEGNAPADVRENIPLRLGAAKNRAANSRAGRCLARCAQFHQRPDGGGFPRQSGGNLLVVGQSEERTTTILAVALVSLAAQFPKAGARFVVFDSTPPGFPQREFLERIVKAVPHETSRAATAISRK